MRVWHDRMLFAVANISVIYRCGVGGEMGGVNDRCVVGEGRVGVGLTMDVVM